MLDVGAGSGILSFFAAQAGAKRIYAVEASTMAHYAQKLVAANNLQDSIKVIPGKIEEIELPEKVNNKTVIMQTKTSIGVQHFPLIICLDPSLVIFVDIHINFRYR